MNLSLLLFSVIPFLFMRQFVFRIENTWVIYIQNSDFRYQVLKDNSRIKTWKRFNTSTQSIINVPLNAACFVLTQHLAFNLWVMVMVFNAIFSNISVISWRSVLLLEETGVTHRPVASHWQTVSNNVVWNTPHHSRDSNSQY